MISLEHVQLLETKVAKAIEYVQRVTAENAALVADRAGLQTKLDANQKRLDELELLVMRFKEDQSRIEDGIVAALDRLSQFEEAFESSLKEKTVKKSSVKKEKAPEPTSEEPSEEFFEISEKEAEQNAALSEDDAQEGELDIF
jgi:FtsZ-binding cell division protein ZapB